MTTATLTLIPAQWRLLHDHLRSSTREERFAVLLVGHRRTGRNVDLFCQRVIPYTEPTWVDHTYGVRVSPEGVVQMMNAAKRAGAGIVEVHTHPGADGEVSFSPTDEKGHREMIRYALPEFKDGSPYGSMVIGGQSMTGAVWFTVDAPPVSLTSLRLSGSPHGLFEAGSDDGFDERRYTRQVDVVGRVGQCRLGQVRVAIVGVGGIGSIVARTLAYEGVRSFTLIDPDVVNRSNLNRLDGAAVCDAWFKCRKVKVLRRAIRWIAWKARVQIVPQSVFTPEAFERLVQADVLIGCTDNEATRLFLSEFAAAYLKPYIDIGSGIHVDKNKVINAAGGRVNVLLPGEGCLLCARAIDLTRANHELSRPELRRFSEAHGYVEGADVPAPAVMSLNQTVAAVATTEFKALVCGLREPVRYIRYDMLTGEAKPTKFTCRHDCLICRSYVGKGDSLNLAERYCGVSRRRH